MEAPHVVEPPEVAPTLEHLTGERLVKDSPAIRKAGWLPRGLWPELDALAQRHDEAVEGLASARDALSDLRERHKAEDKSRVEAIRAGIEPPEVSTTAEREDRAEEAKARITAAEQELADAALAAVESIREHAEEWLADLDGKEREARERREEAKQALVEASKELAAMEPTRHWVHRTANLQASRAWDHISLNQLPTPKPEHPDDIVDALYTALGVPDEERVPASQR